MFEAAQLEDTAHIEMPGMVDINSHEDMFRAVLDKASCIIVSFKDNNNDDKTNAPKGGGQRLAI